MGLTILVLGLVMLGVMIGLIVILLGASVLLFKYGTKLKN